MWLQRKIMARFQQDPKVFDFDAIGGWKRLVEDVDLMPEKFTRLVPILSDGDPDDAFSSVPYEKGFNLLYALEQRVGRSAFEKFAKEYLNKFKFLTVTSEQFRAFFQDHFRNNGCVSDFDWDTWLYSPGMPSQKPNFDVTLSKASDDLAGKWLAFDDDAREVKSPPSFDVKDWSSNQIVCFLDGILSTCEGRSRPLKLGTVAALNDKYGMRDSTNSEILFRYCKIAIASGEYIF